ncbi:BA75_00629T0 [Komagataella pastoris]|uniref:asparaginase n=1 Tax=Komagataella pastoris TaxID=4922 RepID=A0A1B2J686_PICPA|nr:BA75_00629T0 [Komagataella pastoris]
MPADTTEVVCDDCHTVFHIRTARSYSGSSLGGSTSTLKTPRIKVIGTGGTIASKGESGSQTAGYHVDLTIEDLLSSIPDLSNVCELEYEQILNVDSKEFGEKELLMLHEAVSRSISDDLFDGVVITHGTDTMEETAFLLQLTVNTSKPIVMAGSMRPSTAISADGPMNLYQAICVACNKESWNRGVLIALNDQIGSGFYITKSNANSLDTFKSVIQGYLGNIVNNEIHYFFPASKPTGIQYFKLAPFPKVIVLYAHQGFDPQIVRLCASQLNVQGIIFATMGAGSLSKETNIELYKAWKEFGTPIVFSKRSMDGMVPIANLPRELEIEGKTVQFEGCMASGYLNPQKSRILLQLCLGASMNDRQIADIFKTLSFGG